MVSRISSQLFHSFFSSSSFIQNQCQYDGDIKGRLSCSTSTWKPIVYKVLAVGLIIADVADGI